MNWTNETLRELLPKRDPWGHKGDFGKLLLLCGSVGFTGAAYFSAMGALRSGAGLVYLGVPRSIYEIEAIKLHEPVVFPLPDEGGMLSTDASGPIMDRLSAVDAVLIGPGLGQSPGTVSIVKTVLEHAFCPVVIDADGINILAAHKDLLRGRDGPSILTPHDGEFRRLGGRLCADRMQSAGELARELNAVVLLKGHETCVTDGVREYRNHTGNAGMAVGGSGDVLAGIIVSLIGQGLDAFEASVCGAWLHGAAGDLCEREMGQYAMLPSDMLDALARLMK